MILFIFLCIVGLFITGYYTGRGASKQSEVTLVRRNREWAQFIASYIKVAKTKDQRTIIKNMLDDIKSMGLPTVDDGAIYDADLLENQNISKTKKAATLLTRQSTLSGDVAESYIDDSTIIDEPLDYMVGVKDSYSSKNSIDGSSLLLYFGAFLFIASAGLFVAFGSMPGTVKTLLVLLLVAFLYVTGLWLFKNREKFYQVGITFAGMSLAIAPLIGVTAYNYIFTSSNGQLVWFMTSVLCIFLYGHAMYTLQKPLINYLFIFTVISLFESSASIIDAPVYIYGWILLILGLLTQFIAYSTVGNQEFRDSSKVSSYILTPLAILTSLAMVPSEGLLQLAITLFIGALYYLLQSRYNNDSEITQDNNVLVSHALTLCGIGTLTYALSNDWVITSAVLIIVNTIQSLLFILFINNPSNRANNFALMLISSSVLSALISLHDPVLLLTSIGVIFIATTTVWAKIDDSISYALSLLTVPIAGVVYSLNVADPSFTALQLALVVFAAMITQVALQYIVLRPNPVNNNHVGKIIIILTGTVSVLISFGDSAITSLALTLSVSLVNQIIAHVTKDDDYALVNSVLSLMPLARAYEGGTELFYAFTYALFLNIIFAIRYRLELFRWVGSFVWFMGPMAFSLAFSLHWGSEEYTIAYMAVTVGFLLARSIARGVLFLSAKIPLVAYDKNKSLSYVIGYCLALVVAFVSSLYTHNSQLFTTITTLAIMILIHVLAVYIEKQRSLIMLQPLLVQILIFSLIRPDGTDMLINIYASTAVVVAAVWYWLMTYIVKNDDAQLRVNFRMIALITAYTPVVVAISTGVAITMPISMALAGLLTLHFAKSYSQMARELAGAVVAIAVMWFLYFIGVDKLQAYTHIVALLCAIYAYWRYTREENDVSTLYVWAALSASTIPLALQALNAESGGVYGWWLLLEQVVFLLLGLSINNKTITFWGLYVAIAAVLYQLRDLGWAALTVLALTILGIAIYKISKSNNEDK